MPHSAPTITSGTRSAYGSGGAMYGVVYNSHYFVLIYYSQVLGLEPGLAGLAVGIGLVVDAISDPLIGYLSDSTRSRWGRRHPWIIASILPLCASFYFLWHPPDFILWHPPDFIAGDTRLFLWLVVCNVCMRTGLTMFLVPAYAMVAELSADYDQRTRLLTNFHVIYSLFSNGMSVAMYGIWLLPTAEISDGVLNAEGYRAAGTFGAVVIAVSILAFVIGLWRFIPRLKQYRINATLSPKQFARQVTDVFGTSSARCIIAGGVLYYAGTGTYVALWVYIYSYFWEFTNQQVSIIAIPMAISALFLPPAMARWAKGREKKNVAIFGLLGAMLINVVPITLRLLGFFPENGSEVLFYIMLVAGFFETIAFLVFDICWRSMIADLTEQLEAETGRRNEGVISSTITFTTKCSDALGTSIAGILLSLIVFPTETAVGDVAPEVIARLGLIYGPLVCAIWLIALVFIRRYAISRTRHTALVDALATRRLNAEPP